MTWPKEFGGRGASPILQVIYQQEEANYLVPLGFFDIGLGMCIPTMMAYATPEQLKRYVKPALHGDEVWCQLFSEPAAGSDVAGIRTRAERDGEGPDAGWVINGQKVWTSGAHYCDYGIVITRTDPNVPKHAGLTMFFLDMKTPGVEVRPIKQISGGANFNEVFFTDVRIPDSQRLGKVGEGWKAALTTLMNERLAVGLPSGGLDIDELMELARDTELEDGPAIRNQQVRGKIAEWYVQQQGLKLTRYRTLTALQGPDAGAGILDHQDRGGAQDAGHGRLRHGADGPGRHHEGGRAARRGLPGAMDRRRRLPHRRRHRRDPAQHRGRARAGPAGRHARRQGCAQSTRTYRFNQVGASQDESEPAMNRLDGKVAFLSGAARGIGGATAKLMSKAGAKVAIGDVLDEPGRKLAKEIDALYVHLDVTSEASWAAAMDATVKKFGKLDVLVNNAGIFNGKGVEDATLDEWHRLVAVNLTGVVLGTRRCRISRRVASRASTARPSSIWPRWRDWWVRSSTRSTP